MSNSYIITIVKDVYQFSQSIKSEVAQSCLTLCDPMDCSLPGSSIDGMFQARILEWVAIFFSRGSSWPRDRTQSPALQADSLPSEARNHHPNNRHTHTHTRTQKNRLSASQNSYQNKSLRFAYKPSSCLPKSMTGDVILNISKSEWP